MADSYGFTGRWLDRVSDYNNRAFKRLGEVRDQIEGGRFDSKSFFKVAMEAYDDTFRLFTASWLSEGSAPDIPMHLTTNADAGPTVAAVDVGETSGRSPAIATDLVQLRDPENYFKGGTHSEPQVQPEFLDGDRSRLKVDLVDLGGTDTALSPGYYRGAVFVEKTLIANLHLVVE